jgi:hypothetical protein
MKQIFWGLIIALTLFTSTGRTAVSEQIFFVLPDSLEHSWDADHPEWSKIHGSTPVYTQDSVYVGNAGLFPCSNQMPSVDALNALIDSTLEFVPDYPLEVTDSTLASIIAAKGLITIENQ